jgi:hypothetical protein
MRTSYLIRYDFYDDKVYGGSFKQCDGENAREVRRRGI